MIQLFTQKTDCIRNALCLYPNFPSTCHRSACTSPLLASIKIIKADELFSRGQTCPLHRWSVSHVTVMAGHAERVTYKNGRTQSTSAPLTLCLELPLFQDGFPSQEWSARYSAFAEGLPSLLQFSKFYVQCWRSPEYLCHLFSTLVST